MKLRDRLLVRAAAMRGPHLTFRAANGARFSLRAAITALRADANPRIARLANSVTAASLENRLRRYTDQMVRLQPAGIEFVEDPLSRAALRYLFITAPDLPDDDPDIQAARDELLQAIRNKLGELTVLPPIS
jgi:hypothetical protein